MCACSLGGHDYGFFPSSSLNFTLSIPSSQSRLTFPVIIRDDNIIERREYFTVTLLLDKQAPLASNIFIQGPDKTQVIIIDNDGELYFMRPTNLRS